MMNSWLIDTNVLIYAFDQNNDFHSSSYDLLTYSIAGEISCFIAQQNLLEFWAVVTNPKRVKNPLSIEETLQKVLIYQASFPIVCPLPKTFITFSRLISTYSAFKNRIFDLYLAATALDNGIWHICTWNKKDFLRLSEIKVMTPYEILSNKG